MATQRVICGDCREVMAGMGPASFDAVVTDPPYDLTDLGRRFPGSGGTLRPDGGVRSESRHGGFMGKEWDGTGVAFDPATWEAVKLVLRPGGVLMAFGGTRTWHRLAVAIEDAGFQVFDTLMWVHAQGFPKHKSLLKPAWEPVIVAKRPGTGGLQTETVRIAAHGRPQRVGHDGSEVGTLYGGGFGGSHAAGTTDLGRYPPNLAFTHHPECRETGVRRVRSNARPNVEGQDGAADGLFLAFDPARKKSPLAANPDGTEAVVGWDCHPACPIGQLDRQAGERQAGARPARRSGIGYHEHASGTDDGVRIEMGGGSASRFFATFPADPLDEARLLYCPKAGRRERDAGLDEMPAIHRANGNKWTDQDYRVARGERTPGRESGPRRNHHPCVKPLALMQWLVRLACPAGGTILDPFAGSGTTGCAAAVAGLGFVGIEQDPEYVAIAERRIAHWAGSWRAEWPGVPLPGSKAPRSTSGCYGAETIEGAARDGRRPRHAADPDPDDLSDLPLFAAVAD